MNIVPVKVTDNRYILVDVCSASQRGVVISLATERPLCFSSYKSALIGAAKCKLERTLVSYMSLESWALRFEAYQKACK